MPAISPEKLSRNLRERKTPKWYHPLHYILLAAVVVGMLYIFWQLARGVWTWIASGFETTSAFGSEFGTVAMVTLLVFVSMVFLEQWEAERY